MGLNTQKNTVVLGRANNNWTQMIAYPYTINPNTAYHLKLVTAGKRIEVFVNNVQVLSAADDTYLNGAAGLRVMGTNATFSNVSITDNGSQTVPTWNFSSVKGAVYTPTNAVNYIEWWQSYDSAIVDRELAYAQIYGINTVAIYLHYLLWENDKAGLLNKLENFLQIANRRGIKVSPIFFDDCWGTNADGSVRQPALGAQARRFPAFITAVGCNRQAAPSKKTFIPPATRRKSANMCRTWSTRISTTTALSSGNNLMKPVVPAICPINRAI